MLILIVRASNQADLCVGHQQFREVLLFPGGEELVHPASAEELSELGFGEMTALIGCEKSEMLLHGIASE